VALALASTACSGATETGNSGARDAGSSAASADVLALIRQNNDLARINYDLSCSQCACGRFLDVSEAAEQCMVEVLNDFPAIRDALVAGLQCSIAKAQEKRTCLEAATSCPESQACSPPRDGGTTDCERIAGEGTLQAADFTAAVQQRCGMK
jgi:hypothetical protein